MKETPLRTRMFVGARATAAGNVRSAPSGEKVPNSAGHEWRLSELAKVIAT